jgi:hypothetical protein
MEERRRPEAARPEEGGREAKEEEGRLTWYDRKKEEGQARAPEEGEGVSLLPTEQKLSSFGDTAEFRKKIPDPSR